MDALFIEECIDIMASSVAEKSPTSEKEKSLWHALAADAVLEQLQSDPETGLGDDEARQRQEHYGPNALTAKKGRSPLVKFLLQFNDPLLYILIIAGTVKAFLGEWVNAGVIWAVTVINALISFVQEAKAENAIAALAASVTTEATVLRNGEAMRLASTELVPGDIVQLSAGDKVPADMRLLQARNLQVDESSLTGESVAAEKHLNVTDAATPLADRNNMVYAGSFVTYGQGQGIVTTIGNDTETGRISALLGQENALSTPLTRKFSAFSHMLVYVIVAVAAITFGVGVWRGQSAALMFEAAVALAVSAIPEGLPAVVTITLATGVSRMAKRHAIIRKLPAVETLGSTTIICSDKTGTLTENQMTVQGIYAGGHNYHLSGGGYQPEGEIRDDDEGLVDNDALPVPLRKVLEAGVLCNDSSLEQKEGRWKVIGDPTEGAFLTAARKAAIDRKALQRAYPRIDSIPFDSSFKYMATLHRNLAQDETIIYVKGSVESVLQRCEAMLGAEGEQLAVDVQDIEARIDAFAYEGLRILAVAYKSMPAGQQQVEHEDIAEGLVFVGLQAMIDPPRAEAIEAIKVCLSAGIQVKMITGDHINTAKAIASKMGFVRDAETGEVMGYNGRQLAEMEGDEEAFAEAVERGMVFARVTPEQKLHLVKALQSRNEVVAMTGDGVNDGPALKQADIGVAMGGAGTEVAKEASDMILTDDNFASIEAAVEEGRTVYNNIVKAISFILPVNGGESMTIFISALLARDLPILSLQVLWLNMLNSITMTVPFAFEPRPDGVMAQPPRDPDEALLQGRRLWRILAVSAFNWVLIFGMFEWARDNTGSLDVARTMAIQALVAGRIIYLLSISQLGVALLKKLRGQEATLRNTSAVALGIVGAVILQILFSQVPLMNTIFATAPLSLEQWLICIAASLPMLLIVPFVNRFDPVN